MSYFHGFEQYQSLSSKNTGQLLYQGKIVPGDNYGINMGGSLAVTPEILLDTSLSFTYYDKIRYEPYRISNSGLNGLANIGAGFLVSKDLFFTLNAAAGITKDSPDFVFSTSVPYSF